MTRRGLRLLGVLTLSALAAFLVIGPAALGDADPASDVLLGAPAFFPFQPPVATSLQNQLQQELAELQKKGLNLKVAIIQSPVDLGALPNMFGKPQTYADFLDREISFNQPQPLLVVMPQGFGLANAGSPAALAGLKVDAAGKSDGLTRSAILAVQRIAHSVGKPVSAAGPVRKGSGSGGTSPLLAFGAPGIVVLLAVSLLALRQRRASQVSAEGEDQLPES
jgi:hypothetical protein